PETETSQGGVSSYLPKATVLYPLSRSISASGATLCGRMPVLPGNAVANSMMAPALLTWELRPVRSAVRVGEQSAVVWKLLKRRPPAASLSRVGILIGPPKALDWPKPMSSSRTTTTFGAPWGAFTSKRAGGLTSRALSSVTTGGCGSGIGRTVRSTCCATASWLAHRAVRAATRVKVREIRYFMIASVRWTPACVGFGFIDQAILHEADDQCRGQETMCAGGLQRHVVRSVTASACHDARPGFVPRNH